MPKAGFRSSYVSFTTGKDIRDLSAVRMQINRWESERRLMGNEALSEMIDMDTPYEGIVMHDRRTGVLLGLASFRQMDNPTGFSGRRMPVLFVESVATSGAKRGSGTRIMKEIARIAADRKRAVILDASEDAIGFYTKLGMTRLSPDRSRFMWTAEQAEQMSRR